jgi:hypothetical protein
VVVVCLAMGVVVCRGLGQDLVRGLGEDALLIYWQDEGGLIWDYTDELDTWRRAPKFTGFRIQADVA